MRCIREKSLQLLEDLTKLRKGSDAVSIEFRKSHREILSRADIPDSRRTATH